MSALNRVRDALSNAGSKTKNGRDWTCPAHDDRNPSLSLSEGEGRVLLYCHAGCSTEEITKTIGLDMRDLFDASVRDAKVPRARSNRITGKRK